MQKKSSFRLFWATLFSVFLTFIVFICTGFICFNVFNQTFDAIVENSSRAQQTNIHELNLQVTPTTTFEDLSTKLHDAGFIGSKELFILHSKSYEQKPLITGTYTLTNTMSNTTILDLITRTQEDQIASIKLTIPEGYTVKQIAQRVADLGIVSYEDFIEAANTRSYDYTFLAHVPEDTAFPLEGYLFPDTYFIAPDASAESIILKMLDRFEAISSQYTHHLYESPYTLHDILTIASIIEEEARLSEERATISGVIYNRLDTGMKLQMCSTVQYALDQRKTTLSLDDLAVDSPYNTYLYEGLPISPICTPGEDALKAAFMPETHDYFFFVLNDPERGSHSFSSTANQHAAYKAEYEQILDQNFID